MKRENIKEILRYIIVGGLTTLISLGSYYLFKSFVFTNETQLHIQTCTIISWVLCVTFAYFANRKFVFKSNNKRIISEAVKFYLARVSTLIIDSLSMLLLTEVFNINDKLAKIVVQVIIFILNYIFSKLAVFKKKD